jgi:hypothetical protein
VTDGIVPLGDVVLPELLQQLVKDAQAFKGRVVLTRSKDGVYIANAIPLKGIILTDDIETLTEAVPPPQP